MSWQEKHDEIFIREMILFEPWKYKKGTPERGNCWKSMAESLNQLKEPVFRVDDRSLRDRFKLLEKKYLKKRNAEEKASGIAPEEETELEKGLADIIQLFKDNEMIHDQQKTNQKATLEREALQADEFRLQSMETIGDTAKRRNSNEGEKKCNKRRKSDDTIEYLREKTEKEQELKQQEIELKRLELEERRTESNRMQEMMLQQQQQTAALLQQQQQMSMVLLQYLTHQSNKN